MLRVRTIVIYSLLLVLFAGNVGINVFTHICREDGVSVSYFINAGEDHCHRKMAEEESSCCHEDQPSKDDDCCNDEVRYIQWRGDAERHAFPEFRFSGCIVPEIFEAPAVTVELATAEVPVLYTDPSPPDGREILLLKQVWIL